MHTVSTAKTSSDTFNELGMWLQRIFNEFKKFKNCVYEWTFCFTDDTVLWEEIIAIAVETPVAWPVTHDIGNINCTVQWTLYYLSQCVCIALSQSHGSLHIYSQITGKTRLSSCASSSVRLYVGTASFKLKAVVLVCTKVKDQPTLRLTSPWQHG